MSEARVHERLGVEDAAERIVDGERIRRILAGLAYERARGTVSREGARLGIIDAVPQHEHSSQLFWNYSGVVWRGTGQVTVSSPLSLYRFELDALECLDGRLVTSLPSVVERVRSRSERRVRVPAGVLLRLRGADEAAATREVEDVSHRGVRFRLAAADSLARGARSSGVLVDARDRLAIRVRVIVRHVSAASEDGHTVAGASIEPESPEDRLLYRAEVDALIDDKTRTGGSWTRDLFDLYESSGYFELSSRVPSEFAALEQAFRDSSQKLDANPDLGLQVVWPSGRGVEAASAVIALHSRAAFLYHVAKRRAGVTRRESGRAILHAVYERALSWIRDADALAWLVVWVQDRSSFPKRLHLDFVTRQRNLSVASVVSFRALELSSDACADDACAIGAGAAGAIDASWACRVATAEDAPVLAAGARRRFPVSFLEAHALFTPDPVDFDAWSKAGLRRGRSIVIAEQRGRPVAAALVEYGEDGVHLFNLFDVVWFIPLVEAAGAAFAPLLGYVKGVYRAAGKRSFYFANDPDAPPDSWPRGAVDRALIHCTVMSTSLLPLFAEHAWELTLGAPPVKPA